MVTRYWLTKKAIGVIKTDIQDGFDRGAPKQFFIKASKYGCRITAVGWRRSTPKTLNLHRKHSSS